MKLLLTSVMLCTLALVGCGPNYILRATNQQALLNLKRNMNVQVWALPNKDTEFICRYPDGSITHVIMSNIGGGVSIYTEVLALMPMKGLEIPRPQEKK